MSGREKRVPLRHYLEQGPSKAAIARRAMVGERTLYRRIASGQLDRELDNEPVRYTDRGVGGTHGVSALREALGLPDPGVPPLPGPDEGQGRAAGELHP